MAGGYRFAPWPDTNFQRSAMNDDNMNTVFDAYIRLPPPQIVPDNGLDVLIGDPDDTENSSEPSSRYLSQEPSSTPAHGPIHNVPVEILLRIFRFIAPPHTREILYAFSNLTHVCKFWRVVLINQPRVWSTIFVTQKDPRSFVEACLERSHPTPLDVTMNAGEVARACAGCMCDRDNRRRLLPNETDPCEWHFQFESLVESRHANRIRVLDIDLDDIWIPAKREQLALGSCRFFTSSFPRLVSLKWKNEETDYANYLFTTPPFPPTLHSLTYVGAWSTFFASVNNLSSFAFEGDCGSEGTSVEDVRLFLQNNQSLESLQFKYVDFEGEPEGPPIHLPNLKSLSIGIAYKELSTIIRVPALSRLSSLRISLQQYGSAYTLHSTGDGIAFSAKCFAREFAETWEDFTGYARPAIRHVRLEDGPEVDSCGDHVTFLSLLSDAHTLEIGDGYFPFWYHGFLCDLKQLGPQLKIIRFAVSDELEPFMGSDEHWGSFFLDRIEELVKYRFEQGRPFSAVERMVVHESERTNRQEDYVWRCFYGSRKISQYVQPA